LEAWAAEDAKSLRAKVLEILKKGRKKVNHRIYIPLKVEAGKVRFYFHEPVSDEEFVKRLHAAIELVNDLPAESLEGQTGPGEYGLFWHEDSQSWKGQLWGVIGFNEFCFPDNFTELDEREG